EITLREGRNRQVRRMLAAVDLPVKKLERVGMGPLSLKGVARGAWRELSRSELQQLRRAAADPSRKNAKKKTTKKASKATARKPSGSTRNKTT
ncbi:MAG: pseudouridine synthase, partial [Planctomycetota bacterium]